MQGKDFTYGRTRACSVASCRPLELLQGFARNELGRGRNKAQEPAQSCEGAIKLLTACHCFLGKVLHKVLPLLPRQGAA